MSNISNMTEEFLQNIHAAHASNKTLHLYVEPGVTAMQFFQRLEKLAAPCLQFLEPDDMDTEYFVDVSYWQIVLHNVLQSDVVVIDLFDMEEVDNIVYTLLNIATTRTIPTEPLTYAEHGQQQNDAVVSLRPETAIVLVTADMTCFQSTAHDIPAFETHLPVQSYTTMRIQ